MAFILNGKWDGCNSLVLHKCDKVAIKAAASLLEHRGATKILANGF
jgi:hypothetical protein